MQRVKQALDGFGRRRAAAHEQDRVVAAERAGDFRQLRAIDPLGQTLRLTAIGPHDQQRVHALEAAHQRRHARASSWSVGARASARRQAAT